jgi:regulator of replication initiation timing
MTFYTYHPFEAAATPELTEVRVKVLAKHLAEVLRENWQLRDEVEVLKERIALLEVTP